MRKWFFCLPLLCFSTLFGLENEYPVIILGSGVGGLTASLYLSLGGINSLVVEGKSPGGRLTEAPMILNWPGEKAITGNELVKKLRMQVEEKNGALLDGEVVSVDFSLQPFMKVQVLVGEEIKTISAKAVIIATGTTEKRLDVKGERGIGGYEGKGVSHCAICDGPFYKDKVVAVVGSGDVALSEADYLSRIAKKVYLVIRKDQFSSSKKELSLQDNVEVVSKSSVQEILGDGEKVTAISLESPIKKELPVDGVFVAIGSSPNTKIFQGKLDLDEEGYIQIKDGQKTSKSGIFAVGDVTRKKEKQALFAAADGANAALEVIAFMKGKEVAKVSIPQEAKKTTRGCIEISTKEQWDENIVKTHVPVVVDFYASWCGPCRRVLPIFHSCAEKQLGHIQFITVNMDKQDGLSLLYQVRSIPTLLFFNSKGKFVARRLGSDEVLQVLSRMEKIQSEEEAASFFKELK
ncbi:MAG: FAD-dependent oxidoreductase [Chlamydiota bacterium]